MTPDRHRYSHRIWTSLLALTVFATVEAQTAQRVPALVVNVVIDQLRTDYMEAFAPLYGEGGFKRLMTESRMYTQAEYPFGPTDRASAVASLMTGCSPYENGIVGDRWLDRQTLIPVYCVDDEKYGGLLTTELSSPQNLTVSTISDELKISTEGKSMVYAMAAERDAAILAAGHAADMGFWIDDLSGNWASTKYYGEMPKWVLNYQNETRLSSRIAGITWEPLNEQVSGFDYFGSGNTKEPFRYEFDSNRKFREFKTTACANEEVCQFATYALKNTELGADETTDMLNLVLYAGVFDHQPARQHGMELQDIYARMDRQLAALFGEAERKAGAGRVLFVVTSTGYTDDEDVQDLSKYRIPTGNFSISKAKLLLNMYLIAVYGEGQYVDTSLENQIYLNLKLIENKNLNLTEVLERSSDFLIQLSGVKDVFTSQRLALAAGSPEISKIRNGYNPKCSGDILIQVTPGWVLTNDDTQEQILSRESYIGFPLFIMGADIEAEKVHLPVDVTRVAPTLAKSMRIRAPNGCSQAPLNY